MKTFLCSMLSVMVAVCAVFGICGRAEAAAGKKAIVVVSFGTTFDEVRASCIESVEKDIAAAFPDYDVHRAFTSKIVMKRLAERGVQVNGLEQTLESLKKAKVKEVIVQPTHLTPGEEFDNKIIQVVNQYKKYFNQIIIGRPLLALDGSMTDMAVPDDFTILAEALKSQFPAFKAGEEIVFLGHGSPNRHNSAYAALQSRFDAAGLPVTVGVVEETDHPNLEDVIVRLQQRNVKSITFMPLMLVAGDHANNDMIGDEEDSWKNILRGEGYDINTPYVHGLGENEAVRSIYVQHVRDAIAGRYIAYIK